MGIPSQQIGQSATTKLLYQISKQLEQLTGVMSKVGQTTTPTTTTAAPTTTTTTTTISATTYNLKSGSTQFNVCSGSVNLTLYGNSPSLSIGLQLYTDSGLTTTFTAPYTPFLIGYGSGINDPVWEVNASGLIISQYGAC